MFSRLMGDAPLLAHTALFRDLVGDGRLALGSELAEALDHAREAREGPEGWMLRDLELPGSLLGEQALYDLAPDTLSRLPLCVDLSGRGADLQGVWLDLSAVRRLAAHTGGRLHIRHVRVPDSLVRTAETRSRLRSVLGRAGIPATRLQTEVDTPTVLHDPATGRCPWSDSSLTGVDLRWCCEPEEVLPAWVMDWVVFCVERRVAFHLAPEGTPELSDDVFEDLMGLLVGAMLLAQGVVTPARFHELVGRPAPLEFDGPLLAWHGHILTASEIQLLRRRIVLGYAAVAPRVGSPHLAVLPTSA